MAYLVSGAIFLFILVAPRVRLHRGRHGALVRFLRYGIGTILIVVGGFLVLAERWGLALPLIAAGISAISIGRIGPIDLGGGRRSSGTRRPSSRASSTWRSITTAAR